MKTESRFGLTVAGFNIAFSLLAIMLYFAFTPVVMLAAILGVVGAAFALMSGARRTALVACVFALVPLFQMLIEWLSNVELLVLVPSMLALVVAIWTLVDYAAERRGRANATM